MAATLILIGIVAVYLLVTSVYPLDPDKLLAYIRFGSYRAVGVSGDFYEDMGPDKKDAKTNLLDLFILPYPFYRGTYFPTNRVKARYRPARINDKSDAPLDIELTIAFELDARLGRFIRTFNVIGKERNMAAERDIRYLVDIKSQSEAGETEKDVYLTYKSPCLAQYIVNETTDVVWDRIRHMAGQMTFKQLKGNLADFEKQVRYELASPESAFARSGILIRDEATHDGVAGPTIRPGSFDFNIRMVDARDPKLREAWSAPAIAKKQAEASAIKGKGEGRRIKAIQDETQIDPVETMRNETMREAEELNVFAAGEPFSAVIQRLVAGDGGKNKQKP